MAGACTLTAGPLALAQVPPATDVPATTAVPPGTDPAATSTTIGGETPGSSTASGPTTSTIARPPAVPTPGGFGGPPVDPNAPPEPPMADPSPQVRVLLTQLRAHDHLDVVAKAEQALAAQQVKEQQAHDVVAQAVAAVRRAEAVVATDRDRLRGIAITAYMDPSSSPLEQVLEGEPADGRRRDVLVTASAEHNQAVLHADEAALRSRRGELEEARAAERAEVARTAQVQGRLDGERGFQSVLEQNINTAVYGQSHGVPYELPIMGLNVFKPEELAAWFVQHGVVSHAQASVTDLATWYLQEGRDEGVRGDMAFAQSVLETGSFTNDDTRRFNNFAGVGHCDTCPTGFAFATPQLGVRAQIQLLKQYSEGNVTYKNPLVDRRLRGPAGCCPTWTDLTHIWATNGNYGPKIMSVYREMLHWLVLQRGLTPLDRGP